jgi:hypothetical protein
MPPALPASPHLVTPSRADCTAPPSSSPRPLPLLVCGCPRRKPFSLHVCCSAYSSLTHFSRFGLGGKIRSSTPARVLAPQTAEVLNEGGKVEKALPLP